MIYREVVNKLEDAQSEVRKQRGPIQPKVVIRINDEYYVVTDVVARNKQIVVEAVPSV